MNQIQQGHRQLPSIPILQGKSRSKSPSSNYRQDYMNNEMFLPFASSYFDFPHQLRENRANDHAALNDNLAKSTTTYNQYHLFLDCDMKRPLRSQSFKHRQRSSAEAKRYAQNNEPKERRRSTPNISRRSSFSQRNRIDLARTDVWPEPKISVVEERFLKLPDFDDYKRVRQFKIDEKGAVVSRGDSFRLKTNSRSSQAGSSPYSPKSKDFETASTPPDPDNVDSDSHRELDNDPTTSHHYEVYIIGSAGTGKTTLIGQFITSDYRNTFATEIESSDNFVSVNIGGEESELTFYEADANDNSWMYNDVHMYLLLYSIDSRSSLKETVSVLRKLRECESTKDKPIIMTGNKADLERKRSVKKSDARNAFLTYGVSHYEISVALNHHVDELLVGLIAEIRQSFIVQRKSNTSVESEVDKSNDEVRNEQSDFRDAIRRFSRRNKHEMGFDMEQEKVECAKLKPLNIFGRFCSFRKSLKKSKKKSTQSEA